MRPSLASAFVLALTASSPAAAADVSIGDFQGQWRGVSVEAEGFDPAAVQPGVLDLALSAARDGFRAQWATLERGTAGSPRRQTIDARFAPTGRPGVYAFEPEPGSLLTRLFASPATGNPLEGETLLWARLEGATLHLYSLVLHPDGGFDLDRWAHTLEDEGLRSVLTRRDEGGTAVIQGRLQRQDR